MHLLLAAFHNDDNLHNLKIMSPDILVNPTVKTVAKKQLIFYKEMDEYHN